MTRKEEIRQAAHLYSPNNAYNTADTWEYACEWADKTMLVKACEWLDSVRLDYYAEHIDELIEDFRKAMKGE